MVVIKGTAIWATDLDIILEQELPPSKSKMSCQIVLLTTKNEHSIGRWLMEKAQHVTCW